MVDFSPKTVFRKNPCDFFRLKTPKNEEDDGPPKTAVKTVPPVILYLQKNITDTVLKKQIKMI